MCQGEDEKKWATPTRFCSPIFIPIVPKFSKTARSL